MTTVAEPAEKPMSSFEAFCASVPGGEELLAIASDARATDADEPFPAGSQGESFHYGGGTYVVSESGVYFVSKAKQEGVASPPLRLCSSLKVVAATRDAMSGAWGRLLQWPDADAVQHRWAMPMELLQGDGVDVRRELSRMGLTIAPGKFARERLTEFLSVWPASSRARCVERMGWHGGTYVTPGESIGERGELVVFQNTQALEPALSQVGTGDQWRESVARLASENSRLVFAISAALAAPLADVVGEDSGGFHLRGASSTGKSTALRVAASVWGSPETYPRLWRATANGLEGLAALHNDGLLILDELSQCDPREAGEAAYLLANGQGKTRASRTGNARQSARWRLLFLSAGEESLSGLMQRAGRAVNVGQEVRLADIPADAGAGLGLFETLHDQPSAAALALALKDMASAHHGAVGVEWLRRVVASREHFAAMGPKAMQQIVALLVPPDAGGQVLRVAKRFALVALAGEIASGTTHGPSLTGWRRGMATECVRKCFLSWLAGFGGTGNREDAALLHQVRAFFEAHGSSRFARLITSGATTHIEDRHITNRAGFVRAGEDGHEYLVMSEAFRSELCKGFDPQAAGRTLKAAGWLVPPTGESRLAQSVRIPGLANTTRCYIFNGKWST